MTLVTRIKALLIAIEPRDFDAMAPAERRRTADLLRHTADMAEPPPAPARPGVLHELGRGIRAD
jgi:hypothetical protein